MYNVIIHDKYLTNEEDFYNQLVFYFETKERAIRFAEEILEYSDYSIEVIQIEKGE